MKKFFILIITFILLFSNSSINVNAEVDYSGEGLPFSGSGGTGGIGPCNGGWCLLLSPILKFSLVKIDSSILETVNSFYMINYNEKFKAYNNAFKSDYNEGNKNNKITENDNTGYAMYGNIENNNYDVKYQYLVKEFPKKVAFSNDIMKKILPNKHGLNFSSSELKNAIVKDCDSLSSSNCEITKEYEKIVMYMLSQANLINNVNSLSDLDNDSKKILVDYRVIIEPVYTFKQNSQILYRFMTTKSIAKLDSESTSYKCKKAPCYGLYPDLLYKNLIAADKNIGPINSPDFISVSGNNPNNYLERLADVNNGAGYTIVRVSYDIPEGKFCEIEKDSEIGKILYYDSNGDTWEDDIRGDNLNYFLNSGGCNCDDINNSEYKTEIINTEIKENILKNNCSSGTCVYDEESKIFYGSNSEKLNTYEGFIESCECTNSNVVALKEIGGFSSIYSTKCPTIVPIVRVSSNLKKCTVKEATENYEIEYEETKSINNYCSLNCKETINFNDVYGKYSVRAGEYFELGKYPTLKANKSCNVNVDYNKWKSDYDNLVIKQTKYLTDWNKYKSSMMPTQSTQTCSCDEFGNCIYATLYTASYYGYSYNGVNITKSSVPITFSWGGCFNSPLDVDSSAEFKFNEVSGKIENLFSNLKTCSNYLNRLDGKNVRENSTSKEDYYTFKSDLKYYYYQDNPKYGTINNTEKANNVDDSAMEKVSVGESRENGNFKNYIYDIKSYPYIDSSGNLLSKNVGANYYNELINRTVEFNYEYKPSIIKYVDSYTSEINSNFGSLSNPVLIGNVYDTDAISIAKNDNDNYFSFTSLGDDNQIFEWFKAGKKVLFLDGVRNARKDDLNRYCDYEITNDLFETSCNGTSICDSKLKVIYRSVDPLDIDPNDRLLNDKGFSNWKNVKGKTVKAKIEDDAKKDLTYSPDNLEYSFTLDSQAIQAIRSDNITKNYDDFQGYYTCIEGNKCESEFISNANAVDGKKGDIGLKFGSSLNGRTSWKEFKEELGKFYIDNEEINVIN